MGAILPESTRRINWRREAATLRKRGVASAEAKQSLKQGDYEREQFHSPRRQTNFIPFAGHYQDPFVLAAWRFGMDGGLKTQVARRGTAELPAGAGST
jgi:hypothetical protein